MIAILNTGIANAASVLYAIERLGYEAQLTQDPQVLSRSSHVILPGVGTALALMSHLQSQELDQCIRELTQPVLGICLGMQALYDFSEEGDTRCLGVFAGRVIKIQPQGGQPVPHMGWNQVFGTSNSRLLKRIPENSYFYFVHSFQAPQGSETVGYADYGGRIPAVVESSHWFGTQFHPERSGAMGELLLRNFLTL